MSVKSELAELKKAVRYRGGTSAQVDIIPHIAEVYRPVHEDILAGGHQYYNLPGGRGSCKSSFVSLEIVAQIMADETRELEKTAASIIVETAEGCRDDLEHRARSMFGGTGAYASGMAVSANEHGMDTSAVVTI